jgi:serine/threonine protein phosphatase 1
MEIHAPAALAPGRRVYAVGDVHGCLDQLAAIHDQIAADLLARPISEATIIHLGDYIDRGPDSAGVIEHLLRGFAGARSVNLMGNHEHMMLQAVDTGELEDFELWMLNGGRASLRSWQIGALGATRELAHRVPAEHLGFMRGLALSHREGGYLFVHAGLRPGLPIEAQSTHDLLWIREPFLSWRGDFGSVIVHGHTPMQGPVVKANRIGIDTGAVLGGPLTCAVLEEDRLGFLFAE